MRFIKTVTCKRNHYFKNIVGMFFCEPLLYGAFFKFLFLSHKDFKFFLSHGTAEHIGTTKRKAGNLLGNLHNLFLINHDSVSFLKDTFKARIWIFNFSRVFFTFNKVWNICHWTRTVKCVHGNKVVKAVWLKCLHPFLHSGRFKLENCNGFSP